MILLTLTAVGLALGYLLWRFWLPTCLTSTCCSTLHGAFGVGAACDGHGLVGSIFLVHAAFVLGCIWFVDRRLQSFKKEQSLP